MLLFMQWKCGYAAVFLLSAFVISTNGQCSEIGCEDCFSWCSTNSHFCSHSVFKAYCKKTCKVCPTNSPVCQTLGCNQTCVLSDDFKTATCACIDGYRLDKDGESCKDIDECSENPSICNNVSSSCVNTPGSYTCTPCDIHHSNLSTYYSDPPKCCNINEESSCGKSIGGNPGRIANSIDGRLERWPWMVYIKAGTTNIFGGSLITRNYVLTCAHCVKYIAISKLRIIAGVYNTSDDGSVLEQTFKPLKTYIHPNFSFPDNDIALILLDRPAKLSRFVNTVCLPGNEEPSVGQTCYATGYGAATFKSKRGVPVLKELDLPIANTTVCAMAYQNQSYPVNSDIHICAGYIDGSKDACHGDAGGPLVCQRCNNCDWYVAGIISYGVGCATPGYYSVYTRVAVFEEWITGITQQHTVKSTCATSNLVGPIGMLAQTETTPFP